jgi:hypothetical protein
MPFNLIVYSDILTNEMCINTCRLNGYSYAGTQWKLDLNLKLNLKINVLTFILKLVLKAFALIYLEHLVW